MHSSTDSIEQFETLLHSILLRLIERTHSDAALFRLLATHSYAHLILNEERTIEDLKMRELLDSHAKIQEQSFAQLQREYCRDSIVVAATMFDSFLTDVTRFLLLVHPTAVPKDRLVRVTDVLKAGSYSETVSNIVEKLTHELSYKNVLDRVSFLEEKFGIETAQMRTDLERIQEIADLRNGLIHAISRYKYSYKENIGEIHVEPLATVRIAPETADAAINHTIATIVAMANGIGMKVFGKCPEISEAFVRIQSASTQ